MSTEFEIVASIEKPLSPDDQFFAPLDVSTWLGSDTISSVVFTAVDSSGRNATTTVLESSENTNTTTIIYPYIKGGGTSDKRYTVKMLVTTASGDKKSFYLKFKVKEFAA
jgi:hypothetical protein